MSIATNLQKLETDITNAYDAVQTKGGTIPTDKNTNNLATAISSISGGGDIDWSEIGYSGTPQTIIDGFNYAKNIYDNWDSSRTSYLRKFASDENLVYMPLVDTSNGQTFERCFTNCLNLVFIPAINTSNATNFSMMFYGCEKLKEVPQIDTSKGENFSYMFYGCKKLKEIPQIDTSKGQNFEYIFNYYTGTTELETIPELDFSSSKQCRYMFYATSSSSTLKNLGGFLNLGKNYSVTASSNLESYRLQLNTQIGLTHDSLMNVINKLYDIATKGCNTQKLVLGSTNLAKLTAEEIAIATNKGWSVS